MLYKQQKELIYLSASSGAQQMALSVNMTFQ